MKNSFINENTGQKEITKKQNLLTPEGHLSAPGYSRRHLQVYNRSHIKASGRRIKEWDYYYIGNEKYGIALTVADNSYMGLDSISLLDFLRPWQHTKSPMQPFTFGKKKMPSSTLEGNVKTKGKNYFICFEHRSSIRHLSFYMDDFYKGKPIEGDLTLKCPDMDSMIIATPFNEDDLAFYYNEKINCMPASGIVKFDGRDHIFDPSDSFGVLDWGRGVWTYKNTWFWGSASGLHEGSPFGFNIGYGFGDTSAATENMIIYKNKGHKISRVKFNIPDKPGMKQSDHKMGGEDFLSPWSFTSDDGRFEMDFIPVIDRSSRTDLGIICSNQHQVFGSFSGKAVLDDGTLLKIKNLPGFAEKVFNKW